ncbi:unnamed protein product [Clonostachys rhizophaga]|uniref:SnoaL-like domain-containing protein n=1 Tax=Clonostachys rhizophaga TaxID=160324 RepID=A0A9N9YHA6_9HYPO|nr:unnamed protein product [Clonostachys rhizophaga]
MSSPAILARVDKIWREQLTDQPPQTSEQIEKAKKLIELFEGMFTFLDYSVADRLLSEDYIQHNVTVGTGRQSIIEFAEREAKDPNKKLTMNYKRVLVDGDFVFVHLHIDQHDGTEGLRAMEILRHQNGVFTEHWDSVAPIPPRSEHKNPNGVF